MHEDSSISSNSNSKRQTSTEGKKEVAMVPVPPKEMKKERERLDENGTDKIELPRKANMATTSSTFKTDDEMHQFMMTKLPQHEHDKAKVLWDMQFTASGKPYFRNFATRYVLFFYVKRCLSLIWNVHIVSTLDRRNGTIRLQKSIKCIDCMC
jgi:hypothetical protein